MNSPADYVIETRRLGLRRMLPADAPFISSMFEDDAARRFYPDMWRPAMGVRWVDRNLERYQDDGLGLFVIELLGTGERVGDCGLIWQVVEGARELEVGYHLHAMYRGLGIATEAAAACMAWGFARTSVSRIVSMVHPDNKASHGVAMRIHRTSHRFERQGVRYFLYCTDRVPVQ